MIRNVFQFILFMAAVSGKVVADENDSGEWRWLPSGITYRPALASVYEPRVGFTYFGKEGFLRLDVGSGIDLIGRTYRSGNLAIGAEFFIWTLLESWENFHFPVIASDYFFGVNISYNKPVDRDVVSARLRVTHISSHFVDGHFDKESGNWRDDREPRVYSREFVEFLGSYQVQRGLTYRLYGGGMYLFSVTPSWLGRVSLQAGVEILAAAPRKPVTPYLAYDMRLIELDSWYATHSAQIGVKLGYAFGRGIDIFGAYFSGLNVHGELFDAKITYWGGGFNLHL